MRRIQLYGMVSCLPLARRVFVYLGLPSLRILSLALFLTTNPLHSSSVRVSETGTFWVNYSFCQYCSVGLYSSATGLSVCNKCETGSFAPTEGSTSCISCESGTFGVGIGSTSCVPCSIRYYSDSTGSTICSLPVCATQTKLYPVHAPAVSLAHTHQLNQLVCVLIALLVTVPTSLLLVHQQTVA